MLSRRKWSPHSNLDNAGSPKTQKPTSIQVAQYMNMYQDQQIPIPPPDVLHGRGGTQHRRDHDEELRRGRNL